jgi:Holliday junction resolvase RusA-like endonuclease
MVAGLVDPSIGLVARMSDSKLAQPDPDDSFRSVTITIPGLPAYPLSPNARNHWAVKNRATEAARWAVKAEIANHPDECPEVSGPVSIAWTVYLDRGGRKRDNDNMLACLKAHQDALVREGVICGDSPKWIPDTPTVKQVTWGTHKGDARIVVTITARDTNG